MSNKDLYREVIASKRGVPLFMKPWWLDAVCSKWDVAVAQKGDRVTGIWAYPIEKKAGVSLLRTPLMTPYLGPYIFFPPDIKESNADSFEYETVSELLKQMPDADVWHLALQPGMKQVGLFKGRKLQPDARQTFLIDLQQDEEKLFGNMKDATRRNIKQAEKTIEITNDPQYLGELFKFQKQTLERKGKAAAYTLSFLRKIMDACIAHDAAALWVARKDQVVSAVVWQVWDEHCSYYLMGAQNAGSGNYKTMSSLLWTAVKEAKRREQKTFDLEGSMDEGVERFFRSFGGERALYLELHKSESLLWKIKQAVFR